MLDTIFNQHQDFTAHEAALGGSFDMAWSHGAPSDEVRSMLVERDALAIRLIELAESGAHCRAEKLVATAGGLGGCGLQRP